MTYRFRMGVILVLLLVGGLEGACSAKKAKGGLQPDVAVSFKPDADLAAQATEADLKALVTANNRFAFDFYNQLRRGRDSNLFFSPLSLSTALAMTYAGARGETAAEMARVLHFDSIPKLHAAYAALQLKLDHSGVSNGSQMVQANALWSMAALKKDYTDLVNACYGGRVAPLDLTNGGEASRVINRWVAGQTHHKIQDLVKPEDFGVLCRLVLTNAIYFKGDWDYPFDPEVTNDVAFTLSTGEKVNVPMMARDSEDHMGGGRRDVTNATPFYQDQDFKMVELIYRDRQTSMLFILPRKGKLDDLALTPERLAEATDKLDAVRALVLIPKFSFTLHANVNEQLQALGMTLPFSEGNADFSGMAEEAKSGGWCINKVLHQARIDVDERGSEAAAASAVFMYAMAAGPGGEPPSFIADRPFLFLIRDRSTGAILFLGRVMNPLEAGGI